MTSKDYENVQLNQLHTRSRYLRLSELENLFDDSLAWIDDQEPSTQLRKNDRKASKLTSQQFQLLLDRAYIDRLILKKRLYSLRSRLKSQYSLDMERFFWKTLFLGLGFSLLVLYAYLVLKACQGRIP